METSGAHAALNDALRATRYQGTVVSTAYYVGPASDLILSGEWHRNNLQIVSSRAVFPPPREFSWDDRLQTEALQLLFDGKLQADDLVDPVVGFEQAPDAYTRINKDPTTSIKLGVCHVT
jgi:threonine dehydrogenase-like Zn-dependent dehydrogenase